MPSSSPSGTITQRWTPEALTKAFAAIDDKIGADPADYVEVTISQAQVSVKAIDPKNRANVDQYDYAGAGVRVSPVDVSGNEPGVIEESAFKSTAVKPEVIAAVLNSAVKDSGADGGSVSALTLDKTFANDPEPILAVPVSGPRASKVVRYNLAGELLEVI